MLFGYDIGVISGAENLLKSSFRLSSTTEELAVSAVLIGAVIGGIIGGRLADRFSRRRALIALAILYGAGALLTAFSFDLVSFLAFRIITGVAVSYALDFAFDSAGWGWRPMFGFAVLPALALAIGMLFMSYSPRWLGMKDRWDEAAAVLDRIDPEHKEEELDLLHQDVAETEGTSWRELLRPGRGRPDHPADLRRVLLAVHLAAVLADDRGALPEPAARVRRERGHGRQLEREPADQRHVPDVISVLGKSWTFWLYAIFAALAIVFVWRCVPETRGRPLEHIDEYWANGRRWPAEHRDRAA